PRRSAAAAGRLVAPGRRASVDEENASWWTSRAREPVDFSSERDDFSSNRHLALTSSWSVIFLRNRSPLRIKCQARLSRACSIRAASYHPLARTRTRKPFVPPRPGCLAGYGSPAKTWSKSNEARTKPSPEECHAGPDAGLAAAVPSRDRSCGHQPSRPLRRIALD